MRQSEYAVIGKPVPRVDGAIKTKGEAMYATDISLPGMLYGKILRSPYPHARIVRIDTSKAERLPGVRAVITGKDAPAVKYSFMMAAFPENADQYLLARDKVRSIGEEVAAVAAVSEEIAQEALGLIQVEYEELPALLSMEEATKPGAPLLHEEFPGNINANIVMDFGDVEKGFQESDYVREDHFVTQLVQHCTWEPHVALANFDAAGNLTLWSSTQSPFLKKMLLPTVTGIPESKIRVIKPCMGGGFGGKAEVYPLDVCAILLAKKSGKPVRIYHTREEEFAASPRRYRMEIDLKIGVKQDGTILSRYAKIMMDGGAYNSVGVVSTFLSTVLLTIPYKHPNMKYESYRVYTNNTTCAAMRGHTGPQVHLASEVQMDAVAEALGMDPVDLRIKNGLKTGDVTTNGLKIKSGSLEACLTQVVEGSEWKKKYKKMPPLKGFGIACNGFLSGAGAPFLGPFTASSSIIIKGNTEGTVTILSGVTDMGQGSDTVLSQIVAEELGISMEQVKITLPDTDLTPPDAVTASGRVTYMAGNAAKRAAADFKQKIFRAVAAKLEANAEDLEAGGGRIYIKGSPELGVAFVEAIAIGQVSQQGMAITGEGSYSHEDLGPFDYATGFGNFSPAYTFGAVVAEVEVDRETGRVNISKLIRGHDCGRVINLLGVEGQLDGATAMGLGYALYENLVTEKGRTLNPSFLEYKMPTSLEIPQMEHILVESNDPGGPFGAKEGAEGIISPIAPAILNAIYDATGIRFKELPVTPEMLLRELKKKGGE